MKKIKRSDIFAAVVVTVILAVMLILPSSLGGKGTSPGMSALNQILNIGVSTELLYEKISEDICITVLYSLYREHDLKGRDLWIKYIEERQQQ